MGSYTEGLQKQNYINWSSKMWALLSAMTPTSMQRSLSTSTTGSSPSEISLSGGVLDGLVSDEASAQRLNDSFTRSSIVGKSTDDGVLDGLGLVKAETNSFSTSSTRLSHMAISVPGTISRRKSVSPPTISTELDCRSGENSTQG
jgi:hypothetical protein